MPTDRLRIEPGAAERIARTLDAHADNLNSVMYRLRTYAMSTGFAGFPSADELDAGFRRKRDLAIDHLRQQIDTTRAAATRIRAAGTAYETTDNSAAVTMTESGRPSGAVTP